MNTKLTPRDWQAMALREAAELAGTQEGAARLVESKRYGALADEIERLRTSPLCMDDRMRSFIEGMSVSVDVSTSEGTAGDRYFGTVTEVMEDPHDKHGVTLLVQDAKPNFTR